MTGAVVLTIAGGTVLLFRSSPEPAEVPAETPDPAAEAPPPTVAAEPEAPEPARPARPAAARPAAAPPPPEPVESTPSTGTLIIESDVPGTIVFVDRVSLGTAPATAANLTPGPHQVTMSAPGYDMMSETIEVEPGTRTLAMAFKEIRLDATVAVVHKHAIGSCRGELRASPEGIRYDTTNENDRFTVALADIGVFEVDYLAGNLRIRTLRGRTYNFDHPEGDADQLFAFHQTVEKVRQQVLSDR
jgi:hypothetical protein